MKIRMGFVSNSSSSSFVLVADKEVFDNVMEDMHPYVKHLIGNPKSKMLNGKEVIMKMGHQSSEDWDYVLEDYVGEILNHKGEVVAVQTEEEQVSSWDLGLMDIEDAYRYVRNKLNEHISDSALFDSEGC